MNEGGISKRIVRFASSLLGHIKGSLGYVSILTGIDVYKRQSREVLRRKCPGLKHNTEA